MRIFDDRLPSVIHQEAVTRSKELIEITKNMFESLKQDRRKTSVIRHEIDYETGLDMIHITDLMGCKITLYKDRETISIQDCLGCHDVAEQLWDICVEILRNK